MNRITMNRIKILLTGFSVLVVALLPGRRLQAGEPPLFVQFVRPLGMGGAFTAVADDHNIFSYNPAGMVQRTGGMFTLLEVAPGISQDFIDAANFVSDNESDLTNFDTLSPTRQAELINKIADDVSRLDPHLSVAYDVASYVSGPRFLGMPIHVGFGVLGMVDSTFHLDTGVTIPNISFELNSDIVFPVSIAKRWEAPWVLPGKIGVGLTGKFIRRDQIKRAKVSVLQVDDLQTPPIQNGRGFGSDLGLLYQPTDRLNLGLMVQDFLGTKISFDSLGADQGYEALPSHDTVIRPRTNVGVAVVPKKLLWLLPTNDRWTFALDVRDILVADDHLFFEDGFRRPFGEDLYTHLFMGGEFRYWFLRFRGGAHQGYPAFGLGVDIPFFKINYAFYSIERGPRAGDRREDNHIASIAFRFGSGHVEARERIQRRKEETGRDESVMPEELSEEPEAAPQENPEEQPAGESPEELPAEEGEELP